STSAAGCPAALTTWTTSGLGRRAEAVSLTRSPDTTRTVIAGPVVLSHAPTPISTPTTKSGREPCMTSWRIVCILSDLREEPCDVDTLVTDQCCVHATLRSSAPSRHRSWQL